MSEKTSSAPAADSALRNTDREICSVCGRDLVARDKGCRQTNECVGPLAPSLTCFKLGYERVSRALADAEKALDTVTLDFANACAVARKHESSARAAEMDRDAWLTKYQERFREFEARMLGGKK